MMNHIGIYFTTKRYQTQKIANYLAQWFRESGSEVEVLDLARLDERSPLPTDFDAVLIGSPVYMCGYPREVTRFVRQRRTALNRVQTTGFFSVSLTATPETPEAYAESLGPVGKFLDATAWSPQWIASFPGALNYREYNPVLRSIMRNISAKRGGPTDTRQDYYFTRWDEVSQFAADFFNGEASSRYRAATFAHATRTLNALMPDFEQRIVQQVEVAAAPEEIRAVIQTMQLEDMPLAGLLAWIRNLGQEAPAHAPKMLFQDAAETFGSLAVPSTQQHETVGALVGQFWTRDYGIWRLGHIEEFRDFAQPGYAKVLTNFWFDEHLDGHTILRTETRVHSTSPAAARKFRVYWTIVGLGVRLYMRSVLRGIRRSAQLRRWERRAAAA